MDCKAIRGGLAGGLGELSGMRKAFRRGFSPFAPAVRIFFSLARYLHLLGSMSSWLKRGLGGTEKFAVLGRLVLVAPRTWTYRDLSGVESL